MSTGNFHSVRVRPVKKKECVITSANFTTVFFFCFSFLSPVLWQLCFCHRCYQAWNWNRTNHSITTQSRCCLTIHNNLFTFWNHTSKQRMLFQILSCLQIDTILQTCDGSHGGSGGGPGWWLFLYTCDVWDLWCGLKQSRLGRVCTLSVSDPH